MSDITRMAAVAALLGDPARAHILTALLDGRALTAKELAFAAHVSPQTTSLHLARLTEAGLLAGAKQGRHRYFRLASPLVGQMLESVMAVAGPEPAPPGPGAAARLCAPPAPATTIWPGGSAWRWRLAAGCRARGAGGRRRRGNRSGPAFLRAFGAEPLAGKRVFCRPCLDWSERRPHIAGRLGAALATPMPEAGLDRAVRSGVLSRRQVHDQDVGRGGLGFAEWVPG